MDEHIRAELEKLEAKLIDGRCQRPFSKDGWTAGVPDAPGVYVLWDRRTGAPAYVGETACLQKRMADFGRYPNHSGRRKIAKRLKLDRSDESAISREIRERYELSFVELHFGRKELEEFLTLKWGGRSLLNSATRRSHSSSRFSWVLPQRPRRTFPDAV